MRYNYKKLVMDEIELIPPGKPILTDNIAYEVAFKLGLDIDNCKHLVNLNMKRLADAKKISRYQKGVYYKTTNTVFGEVKPTEEMVITELVTKQNKQVLGYITGDALLHQLGFISLLPKEKQIVTNKYRTKVSEKAHVTLKKPVVEITNENYKYFQLLDVINRLDDGYIDCENPIEKVHEFEIKQNLDKLQIIAYAKKYYPKKTLNKTLDIILEN